MVCLTYDGAKRSMLYLALYLVLASLVFKGIGMLIEGNALALFSTSFSISEFKGVEINLPEFNFDTFSFDGLRTFIGNKISELVDVILPASLVFINIPSLLGSVPTILHMDKTMVVFKL